MAMVTDSEMLKALEKLLAAVLFHVEHRGSAANAEIPTFKCSTGLCYNLVQVFYHVNDFCIDDAEANVRRMLDTCCYSWPKFSGSMSYPVPSGNMASAGSQYFHFYDSGIDMWDAKTQYGRNRMGFLVHCVDFYKDLVRKKEDEPKQR